MKNFLFFLAFVALTSCGGSDSAATADTVAAMNSNNESNIETPQLTKESKDSLFLEKLQPLFGKSLYRKGYLATDHSYPDDIRSSYNGPVKYSGSVDESEMIFTLNKDYTCEFIFKPIGHKNIIKKTATWILGDNNTIILSKDVFVKVEVSNADFPLSEDPFFEYILILKNIKLDNNEFVIEEHNTSRSHFFVQLAIAEQSGEATSDLQYANKILHEMSFDYEMVTSYFYYYGF